MATSSVEEYRWMVEDKGLTHHWCRDMATSSVEEYRWMVELKSINPSLLQGHGYLQCGGVQMDGGA